MEVNPFRVVSPAALPAVRARFFSVSVTLTGSRALVKSSDAFPVLPVRTRWDKHGTGDRKPPVSLLVPCPVPIGTRGTSNTRVSAEGGTGKSGQGASRLRAPSSTHARAKPSVAGSFGADARGSGSELENPQFRSLAVENPCFRGLAAASSARGDPAAVVRDGAEPRSSPEPRAPSRLRGRALAGGDRGRGSVLPSVSGRLRHRLPSQGSQGAEPERRQEPRRAPVSRRLVHSLAES